jgi:hypothetical protein
VLPINFSLICIWVWPLLRIVSFKREPIFNGEAPTTFPLLGSTFLKWKSFLADLKETIDAIRSSPNGMRYTEIHVLFLIWKDDTPVVMREINDLENLFSKLYRFGIHRQEIYGENPGRDTQARVAQFLLEKGGKDHLLILYPAQPPLLMPSLEF